MTSLFLLLYFYINLAQSTNKKDSYSSICKGCAGSYATDGSSYYYIFEYKHSQVIVKFLHRPMLFKSTQLESSGFGFMWINTKKLSTLGSNPAKPRVNNLSLKFNKDSLNLNTSKPITEDSDSLISVPMYKIYTDFQNELVLSLIKKDFKSIGGIYAFVHNETKKLYVGSSFNLPKRLNDHLKKWSSATHPSLQEVNFFLKKKRALRSGGEEIVGSKKEGASNLNAAVLPLLGASASLPRIRFDQLMTFCWTVLLPIVFAFIVLVPCILYSFDIFPVNISLF